MKEIIQAIANVDLHDLLTPYAICIALHVARDNWSDADTKRYGIVIQRAVKDMADDLEELGRGVDATHGSVR